MVIYRSFKADAISSFRRHRYVMAQFYQMAGALGYRQYVNGLLKLILDRRPCTESDVQEFCNINLDEFAQNTGLDGQLMRMTEDLHDELKEAIDTFKRHEDDGILAIVQLTVQSMTPTGYLIDVEYIATCRTIKSVAPMASSGRIYK